MAGKRHVNRIRSSLTAFDEATDRLGALDAARRLRISAEALERDLVKAARKDGRSWGDIGELYGMTKQGAQQRFGLQTADAPAKSVGKKAAPRTRKRVVPEG